MINSWYVELSSAGRETKSNRHPHKPIAFVVALKVMKTNELQFIFIVLFCFLV